MAQFNSKNKATRTARRWFTDMDINMTLHPESKDMVLKYDMQSVARSIKNLMQTNHYERPFAPSLGLNLRAKLFELDMAQTRVLENEINEEIKKAEKEIIDLKNKSPEKINKIAVEASSDLVKQLIGVEVNNSSISAIVEDVSRKVKEKNYGI